MDNMLVFFETIVVYFAIVISILLSFFLIYIFIWLIHDVVLPIESVVKKVKFDNGLYGIRRFNFEKLKFEYYIKYGQYGKKLSDSKLAWVPYSRIYSHYKELPKFDGIYKDVNDEYGVGMVEEWMVNEHLA